MSNIIITIDGPSGVGKGTISKMLAKKLALNYLDSGAIYRAAAWAVNFKHFDIKDLEGLQQFLQELPLSFEYCNEAQDYKIICFQQDISERIRSEACGMHASKLSAIPEVRAALLELQRSFAKTPGLVTDGRDMGTVVFPQANTKIFLTANTEERAKRRVLQLQKKGIDANLDAVKLDMMARDQRDLSRSVAPLKPAEDAVVVDTTAKNIDQVFQEVLSHIA